MAELHETIMGKKLIEGIIPNIAKQLERVADALEKKNNALELLKERYRTLSALDPDPKSKHRMHIKIIKEMDRLLDQIKAYNHGSI